MKSQNQWKCLLLRENSNYDAIILGSDIQIKEPEVPLYALAWKDVQVSKEKKHFRIVYIYLHKNLK